jgi:hypothetical protein
MKAAMLQLDYPRVGRRQPAARRHRAPVLS